MTASNLKANGQSAENQRGRELAQSYFHGLVSNPKSVCLAGYLDDVRSFGTIDEYDQNQFSNGFGDALQELIVAHLTCAEHADISTFRSFVDRAMRCPG
ncbi:MAG: hypothetical protein K2Y31_14255 [Burkholderiales bacterium]|jgi:hypothetical protein|nr:hypothetical protein [Burkholderiales bacterium]